MGNYVAVIDQDLADSVVMCSTSPVAVEQPTDEAQALKSKWLFAVLSSTVQGVALRLITDSGSVRTERNGLKTWRRLTMEYEPQSGSRKTTLLLSVLTPKYGPCDSDDLWRQKFESWQSLVAEYEAITGEILPSS